MTEECITEIKSRPCHPCKQQGQQCMDTKLLVCLVEGVAKKR